MTEYRVCEKCVMDTTATEIEFHTSVGCTFCIDFDERIKAELKQDTSEAQLKLFAERVIGSKGRQKYDCIIGVSGGVDSSYVAILTKQLGLNPLAIHVDNGWNSELAVKNIEELCNRLNIDLETVVLNWNEFRDIQRSFMFSSISNIEIPTDHAIWATLIKQASKHKIKYIISGSNAANESIMPTSWLYGSKDAKIIKSIHKTFGSTKMRHYPYLTIFDYVWNLYVKRRKWIPILNYTNFNKEKAKAILMKEYNWKDYGGKHYESIFTRFFHAYYLPKKFGIDLRRAYYSAEVCSDGIDRLDALRHLESPPASERIIKNDITYVKKKLKLTDLEFNKIMAEQPRNHLEYSNNAHLWQSFSKYVSYFRSVATSID